METKINLFISGVDYSQKTEDRPYCLPLEETGGVHIYVDAATFKTYMDILQEETHEHDANTRCLIPGERKSLIVCHHNCETCPFASFDHDPRDSRSALSLDQLNEDYEYEPSSDDDFKAEMFVEERKAKAMKEISLLSEYQQKLLKLYSEGKTFREIGSELGIGRNKANVDLKSTINLLQERCKEFK